MLGALEHESNKSVDILFLPQMPEFAKAATEYHEIWGKNGENVVAAYQRITQLPIPEYHIEAEVYEGISFAGIFSQDHKMRLRASYRKGKLPTLIHEYGHRYLYFNGVDTTEDLDQHQILDLVLYDIWSELFGEEFAKEGVKAEIGIQNPKADYKTAWDFALAMSKKERREFFRKIVEKIKRPSLL